MTQNNNTQILGRLFETIESRKGDDPKSSYTASLLSKGPAHCARKFGEEAVEAIIAGTGESDQALIAESADTIYHLMVLLAARDLSFHDVCTELKTRRNIWS